MTIFLCIVVTIGLVLIGLTIACKTVEYKNSLTSTPAKKIMALYDKVPESSRPYGDIKEMLKALDLKHGIDDVNRHYQDSNRTYDGISYEFSWYPRNCYHKNPGYSTCEFPEYVELADSLQNIITAHEKQQRAMEIAGVQGSLDMVEQFTKQAREESKIINSVTKELL